jgi:hypothetical protein
VTTAVPTPVHDVAKTVGIAVGLASTVLTAVTSAGILGGPLAVKGKAAIPLLGLLPGLVSGVMTFLAAKTVAVQATPLVTPVSNPTDKDGNVLKPVDSFGKLITSML